MPISFGTGFGLHWDLYGLWAVSCLSLRFDRSLSDFFLLRGLQSHWESLPLLKDGSYTRLAGRRLSRRPRKETLKETPSGYLYYIVGQLDAMSLSVISRSRLRKDLWSSDQSFCERSTKHESGLVECLADAGSRQ